MPTTYFVSQSGSDASNGLGPDASAGTNKPWLTLGKALNTGSSVVPGDTVYIGPGVLYEGAAVSPIAGVSSTASPTAIRGDPLNAQGFKTGAGALLAPSICHITTRTSGDTIDGPITSGGHLLTPATGCHGLQFYDVSLEAGSTSALSVAFLFSNGNADWLFDGCRLNASADVIRMTTTDAMTAGRNLIVRRCVILGNMLAVANTPAAATADADLNILFENNLCSGLMATTSLAFGTTTLAGGVTFRGNTFARTPNVLSSAAIVTTAARVSTVTPIHLVGNLIAGGVSAGTAGQVVDDGYNRFPVGATQTNFTKAGTSLNGFAPNLALPDLVKWGLEMPRLDYWGWTADAHANQKYSAWSTVISDFRNRTIRPWGSGASIGCWEYGLIGQDTGSQITGGGANSLKITGGGEVSIYAPVDATATTLTIITESTTYGSSNWPQAIVVANPSIGVTTQTATAISATEQTLTLGPFTPTAKGVIEIRLISRSTTVTSATYFDSLAG